MNPNKILWIYIILLIIGGLIGFFKAKSKVSLIMSAAFAAALSLCAAGIIFKDYVADILLAALLVVLGLPLSVFLIGIPFLLFGVYVAYTAVGFMKSIKMVEAAAGANLR